MIARPTTFVAPIALVATLLLLGSCRTVTQGPQLTRLPADDAVLPISTLPDQSLFSDHKVTGGLVYQWVGEPYAVVSIERYDTRLSRTEVETARDREAVAWLRRYGKRDQVLPPTNAIAPIDSVTIDGRPGWRWFLGPGEGRPNARRLVAIVPWDEASSWVIVMDSPGDGMTREEMDQIVGSFIVADRQQQDLLGALALAAVAAGVGWVLWRAKRSPPREGRG